MGAADHSLGVARDNQKLIEELDCTVTEMESLASA